MKNILLEVKGIRRCEGGYACSLYANGRKVAFVGPGILEWSSHSKMVDVLEWFADKCSIKISHEPTKLGDNWENKVPDHKNNPYERTEERLVQWVGRHILASEIVKRCKTSVLCLDDLGEFYEYPWSEKEMPAAMWSVVAATRWKCFNKMTKEEVLQTVMTLKRVPKLLPEGLSN
jgi:hypothetical protein